MDPQRRYNNFQIRQQCMMMMWSNAQAAAAQGQMPGQTAQSGAGTDEVRTLWIGDLQYWMDENYLRSCFATTQDQVANVKVIRKKKTMQQSEEYGFIEFYTHAAAQRVLQTFNGAILPNGGGQTFRLKWASAGEKPGLGADDSPIFVGDLASDVTDYTLQGGCYPTVKRLTISSCSSSKKRLTMSSRRWEAEEWLPDEIMHLIICKLMAFPIYLARFSAVCKRWHRLVSKFVKEHRITPPLVFVPLAFPENLYRIDNLMGRHAHPPIHSLPCESPAQIIGSSFGWLIIALNDPNNRSVSLFNPLSKSHIRLPFLDFFPYDLRKGVLSKPPPRPEEEDQHFDIAVTMHDNHYTRPEGYIATCKIAFLHVEKIGELQSKQWVCHYHFEDKILDVSRIGARICILHMSGIISCYNYNTDRFSNVKEAHWLIDERNYGYDEDDVDYTTAYLLESSSSELLVVFRYEDGACSCCCRRTDGFKILTLTSSTDKEIWNWAEADDNTLMLGNDAIFLSNGDGDSVCIQAGSNVAAAAGSIYFTNNFYTLRCCKGNDIGVFNVGQKRITHFIQHVDVAQFLPGPPIWLLSSYDKMLKFSNIS